MASMSQLRDAAAGRDFSTRHISQFFDFEHLPPDLAPVSESFHDLALKLVRTLPDSPELSVALRKLLESKDAAVRSAVANRTEANTLDVERCPNYGQHPGHKWHLGNPHGALYQVPGDAKLVWCRGEAKQ